MTETDFKDFAALVLGCTPRTLWSWQRKLGRRITAGDVADILKMEGRREAAAELLAQSRKRKLIPRAKKGRFTGCTAPAR